MSGLPGSTGWRAPMARPTDATAPPVQEHVNVCDVLRACAVTALLAVTHASSADAHAGMPRGLHALLHLSKIIDTLTRSMRTCQRHVPVMMAWLSAVAPLSENPSRMLNSGTKKAPVMRAFHWRVHQRISMQAFQRKLVSMDSS